MDAPKTAHAAPPYRLLRGAAGFELWHDLSNGAYVLTGLDNEIKGTVKFGVAGASKDFTIDALRRQGTR